MNIAINIWFEVEDSCICLFSGIIWNKGPGILGCSLWKSWKSQEIPPIRMSSNHEEVSWPAWKQVLSSYVSGSFVLDTSAKTIEIEVRVNQFITGEQNTLMKFARFNRMQIKCKVTPHSFQSKSDFMIHFKSLSGVASVSLFGVSHFFFQNTAQWSPTKCEV